jgi:hypothetical protein
MRTLSSQLLGHGFTRITRRRSRRWWGQTLAADFRRVTQSKAAMRIAAFFFGGQNACTTYQEFFNLWKDADPDVPILEQARAEYATLQ